MGIERAHSGVETLLGPSTSDEWSTKGLPALTGAAELVLLSAGEVGSEVRSWTTFLVSASRRSAFISTSCGSASVSLSCDLSVVNRAMHPSRSVQHPLKPSVTGPSASTALESRIVLPSAWSLATSGASRDNRSPAVLFSCWTGSGLPTDSKRASVDEPGSSRDAFFVPTDEMRRNGARKRENRDFDGGLLDDNEDWGGEGRGALVTRSCSRAMSSFNPTISALRNGQSVSQAQARGSVVPLT